MKGRKMKSTALKEATGTLQKCRVPENEATPSSEKPFPPEWLNDEAREVFERLVGLLDEMLLASASQVDMLALLASRLEEVMRFQLFLDDVGTSYETVNKEGNSMWRAYPEVAQKNEAMRHAHALLAEFGLSPGLLAKISVPSSGDENPWDKLV